MILGGDYASVDGNRIDFAKAKDYGMTFMFVRGTYGTWTDPVVKRDWQALKNAGIIRGAYMFPVYSGDAKQEAQAFCNAVGPLVAGDMPPVLDIEFPGHGIVDTGKTPAQALAWLEAAAQTILDHYGTLMTYTSGRVWHEDLRDIQSKLFKGTHLWLARYTYKERQDPHLGGNLLPGEVPPVLGDGDDYWIQQVQGDAVHVPGFSNTVDLDIFRPLMSGARGERVAFVQDVVGVKADGAFGPQTYGAICAYQTRKGLISSGIVDALTFSHMCWEH